MVDIYSTLSTDVSYAVYKDGGADLPVIDKKIVINGGANVANEFGQIDIVKKTSISEADYAALQEHPVFKMHVKNGHITTKKAGTKDLEKQDKSAPATEKTLPTDNGVV